MLPSIPRVLVSSVAVFASVQFAECAPAGAPEFLQERGVCNADNLLRLLRTPSNLPEALPFCSTYLSLPGSTISVSTVTPTVTSYATSFATVYPTTTSTTTTISSSSPTQTISTTDVSTETSIFTEISSITTTATISQVVQPVPRAIKTPLAKQVTESYDSSRISSACACLTIPVAITSVTATAAGVTSAVTLQSTSIAPEVTTVITISLTTTLPEVTQIVTVQTTTDTSVTITQTAIATSTTTLASGPAQTPGFFLRSYRTGDGFYSGNYLINRDISTTNKNQGLFILASNRTAPRLDLTPEGYLTIVQSRVPSTGSPSAATGTEAEKWIAYVHVTSPWEVLSFDKIANVQACSNCRPLVFQQSSDSVGTYLTAVNEGIRTFQVCGPTNTVAFYGLWTSATSAQIATNCFAQRLVIAKEGVKVPFLN